LNVRRALAGHPGIREVTVKGAGELVDVTYAAADLSLADLRRLVMDTVLLPSLRNFLGRPSSSPT
jgi:hypothetical protein